LLNLPLDVLMEIMSFLRPRDLLTLARTCKDFRAYLFSRRSIPCWKAARQRWKDLPDCPSDISEMHYARLVFTEECHNCGQHADIFSWKLRVRVCTPCAKDRYGSHLACPP
ncbi:uncharacterized protein TRAVEDRAFT_80581, partial [Trametes versicolor FP-101664 SS1]|uniref:uncharacterized protein n=1 Tax=Trametes versicolor (strain FP-101664) TaxID=717944 RepID=UPI000462483C